MVLKYEGLFNSISYIWKLFENFNKMHYERCKINHPVFMHELSNINLFCLCLLHGLQISSFQNNVTFEDAILSIHAMLS
jgi:hypothetical protein